jgi:hypothetical protein
MVPRSEEPEPKSTMKRYQKVEDIISLAERFHGEMGEACRKLVEESGREEVKMLLKFLNHIERRLEQGLKQFKLEGDEALRKTRVQYVAKDELLTKGDHELGPEMTLDDVMAIVMEWHSRLEAFYREMSDDATLPPAIREMFGSLAEQEEQEKANLKETAERLKKT